MKPRSSGASCPALELLKKVYPDALTVKEIAKMLGVSRTTASKF
jgi:transposase